MDPGLYVHMNNAIKGWSFDLTFYEKYKDRVIQNTAAPARVGDIDIMGPYGAYRFFGKDGRGECHVLAICKVENFKPAGDIARVRFYSEEDYYIEEIEDSEITVNKETKTMAIKVTDRTNADQMYVPPGPSKIQLMAHEMDPDRPFDEQIASILNQSAINWLDERIPALNFKTPKEAAQTKKGRKQLRELFEYMKHQTLPKGLGMATESPIDFWRKELGMDE